MLITDLKINDESCGCDGHWKAVNKVLSKTKGVESKFIDQKKRLVTITGSVDVKALIANLETTQKCMKVKVVRQVVKEEKNEKKPRKEADPSKSDEPMHRLNGFNHTSNNPYSNPPYDFGHGPYNYPRPQGYGNGNRLYDHPQPEGYGHGNRLTNYTQFQGYGYGYGYGNGPYNHPQPQGYGNGNGPSNYPQPQGYRY